MILPETFLRNYRQLILLTWTLPPVVGLSFLLFIEMFNLQQIQSILSTPMEPIFILVSLAIAYLYFNRFARPFTVWFDDKSEHNSEAVKQQIRRFPLHFWAFFLCYILMAPASVILAAEYSTEFSAQPIDWFRIHLVALIVSILVGLPFFFGFFNLFGKAFGNIRYERPLLSIKTRVFLIASLVPLLMDTMLVQYYWTRTGYFTTETFFVWLALEFLAIAGSLLFIRGFSQSLAPLQLFITNSAIEATIRPISQSTDELGTLTYDLGLLLEEQHLHREILGISNHLLRQADSSNNYEELLNNIIELGNSILDDEILFLIFYDENTHELLGVIDSFNQYKKEGHYRLSMDETSLAVEVFKQRQAITISDTHNDPRVSQRMQKKFSIRSALAVPLMIGDYPVGVFLSARKNQIHHYNKREIQILQSFAQETALIIHTENLNSHRFSAEQRYQKLVELAPDAILLLDENGVIIEVNQTAARLFSNLSNKLDGCKMSDLFNQEQRDELMQLVQLQTGQSTQLESSIRNDENKNTIIEIHAGALMLDEKKHIQIIIQDISQRKQLETAITKIVEGVSTAIGQSFFQAISTQLADILGACCVTIGTIKENKRDTVTTIAYYLYGKMQPDIQYNTLDTPCAKVIGQSAKTYSCNVQAAFPDDVPLKTLKIEAYSGVPLFDSKGQPLGLIATLFDKKIEHPVFIESVLQIFAARTAAEIERTQREEHIHYLAYYDTLTRLPNRELLMDRLHQCIAQASRSQTQLAVMLLDLDHFKSINDTLGHPVGDQLLAKVALRLSNCVREGDTVARLGGDEFVILLSNLPATNEASSDVTAVADKIRKTMSDDYIIESHSLSVSTSIGIAFYPNDGKSSNTLFRHADMAMYHAKSAGRDNYRFYSTSLNEAAIARHEIESELRQALVKDQFELVYQPKVDIIHNRIIGAEALLRWNHPVLGFIEPDRFIPISEDSGQIISIGHWVFEQACYAAVKLWCENNNCANIQTMSINVSPRQFRHSDFVHSVEKIIHKTGVNPACIEIEVTENLLIHDYKEVRRKLKQLKALGIHISIDDFGTGYSSLRYLQELPVDIVKIDHSFVRDIDSNPANAAIVETIIAMATRLELGVIAEGVETRNQLAYLRVQGCTICQGYFFSKPLSLTRFTQLLEQGLSKGLELET